MSRPTTGQVLELKRARGRVFALRFRAGGERQYQTLDVTTRAEAEAELANVLADVRRGIWRPPAPAPVVELPAEEPTFHVFASEWFGQRVREGLAAKTVTDLRWSIVNHLGPFFAGHRLSEITPREVKRYTQAKLAERNAIELARAEAQAKGERFTQRPLSNASINHTLRHLSAILDEAAELELVPSNAASGSRRRLKAAKPARTWVEPEQLPSLLDAAAAGTGRLLLSILAGGGLRIGEALALRWEHVDLGTGSLHVVDSKTAKGVREVHLSRALREALTVAPADREHAPTGYVVATSSGGKHNPSNLRRDVLAPAVKAANARLERLGIAPIRAVTFHSLRRTYASLRCACGDDIRYAADQLGHEDPRFTLSVYAKATKRRDRLSELHRKEYDPAIEWALLGTGDALTVPVAEEATV